MSWATERWINLQKLQVLLNPNTTDAFYKIGKRNLQWVTMSPGKEASLP